MKVICVEYNPMVHESGYITLSIHKTKEGAAKAMNKVKQTCFQRELEVLELNGDLGEEFGNLRIIEVSRDPFSAYRYVIREVEQ